MAQQEADDVRGTGIVGTVSMIANRQHENRFCQYEEGRANVMARRAWVYPSADHRAGRVPEHFAFPNEKDRTAGIADKFSRIDRSIAVSRCRAMRRCPKR